MKRYRLDFLVRNAIRTYFRARPYFQFANLNARVHFYLFKAVRDLQTSRSMPLIFTIRTS